MGYLRGTQTQAIKGTILLGKSQKNDVGLELKPSLSLSDNYLKQDYASLDASNDINEACRSRSQRLTDVLNNKHMFFQKNN